MNESKSQLITEFKRKNLRGFQSHLQGIINRLCREEFPGLGPVYACSGVVPELEDIANAHWYECDSPTGQHMRMIMFNVYHMRQKFLECNEFGLENLCRHELLHGELKRLGRPWGDNDPAFILECLRRRVSVNLESIAPFEAIYGRGSFAMFQALLPPPDLEAIELADDGGVWLREK